MFRVSLFPSLPSTCFPFLIFPFVSFPRSRSNTAAKSSNSSNSSSYLSETTLSPTDRCIIVACDGLWDVISDQECADLVATWEKGMSESERGERVARMLIDEALGRGSTDNISVVVAWL